MNKPARIDLHTHSTASDGTDSPAELARKAKDLGLAAIALTDHDTVAGLDEAQRAGREIGQKVIPGCEISSSSERGEIHILGLWIPEDRQFFETYLADLRARRQERNFAMVEKLRALGLDVSMDEIKTKAGGSVGRPHIAAMLVAKGYVKDINQAFEEYIGKGGKAWLPKKNPDPEEVCQVLADLGATVVLAHPFLRKPPRAWVEALVERLCPRGLSAIEVWHSGHSEADEQMATEIARRHNLMISGGSDYHGKNKSGIALGSGYGSLAVPQEALLGLENWRKARGLAC